MKALESSNLEQYSGSSTYYQYSKSKDVVKSFYVDNQKVVEVEGIEPSGFWLTSQSLLHVTPTASLLYHENIQDEIINHKFKSKLSLSKLSLLLGMNQF